MAHGKLHKRQKASNPARQINNRSLTRYIQDSTVHLKLMQLVALKLSQDSKKQMTLYLAPCVAAASSVSQSVSTLGT
uniref:Uncharacterized protein n=1 Tax=Zea mays TaxID=4577 RepID=C4J1A0_MAIZE|nr:unknown [Zea mays]